MEQGEYDELDYNQRFTIQELKKSFKRLDYNKND